MAEPAKRTTIATYAVVLVIGTALMAAILWALDRFTAIDAGSGGVGVVPPLIAAIVAGQRHAMAARALPRAGYAWTVAAAFVAVTCALSLAGLWILHLLDPTGTGPATASIAPGLIGSVGAALLSGPKAALLAGIILLILWVALRWGYSFGARTQAKAEARTRR